MLEFVFISGYHESTLPVTILDWWDRPLSGSQSGWSHQTNWTSEVQRRCDKSEKSAQRNVKMMILGLMGIL